VIPVAKATECHLSSGQCPAGDAGGNSEQPGPRLEFSRANEQRSTLIQFGHGDRGDPTQVTEESGMHLRPQHPLQQPEISAAPPGPLTASSMATMKAAASASHAEYSALLSMEESKPQMLLQPPVPQPGRSAPLPRIAAAPSVKLAERGANASTDFVENNATKFVEDNTTLIASKVFGGQVLSVPLESSNGSPFGAVDLLEQSRPRETLSADDFPAENDRGLFVAVLPAQVERDPALDLFVTPVVNVIQATLSDFKQHGIRGMLGLVGANSFLGQREVYAYVGPLIFGTLLVCSLIFYVIASCGTAHRAGSSPPNLPNLTTEVKEKPVASKISLGTPLRRSQMNLYDPPTVTTIGGHPLSQKNLAGMADVVPSLCSELVVPEENECSLLLPRVFPQAGELSGQVSIDDVREMSMFHAFFYLPGYQPMSEAPPPRAQWQRQRLVLRSAVDDLTYAYCCDAPPEPGSSLPGYTIYDHEDRAFGTLRPAGPNEQLGFRVHVRGDFEVSFLGDMQVGNVNATDEQGRLLAVSEAINASIRCIRIGPQVDAGFMTLAMLAIDLLRYDLRSARRMALTSPQNCLRRG